MSQDHEQMVVDRLRSHFEAVLRRFETETGETPHDPILIVEEMVTLGDVRQGGAAGELCYETLLVADYAGATAAAKIFAHLALRRLERAPDPDSPLRVLIAADGAVTLLVLLETGWMPLAVVRRAAKQKPTVLH